LFAVILRWYFREIAASEDRNGPLNKRLPIHLPLGKFIFGIITNTSLDNGVFRIRYAGVCGSPPDVRSRGAELRKLTVGSGINITQLHSFPRNVATI
jgi:hypothetical protein